MIELALAQHRRARVWLDEWPPAAFDSEDVLTRTYAANPDRRFMHSKAAVELTVPLGGRCLYGLLGAAYYPDEVAHLDVAVYTARTAALRYPGSLVDLIDEARVGLPPQWAPAVMEGVAAMERNPVALPPGRLTFACAAHGLVGSNDVVFSILARAVIRAMMGATCEDTDWMAQLFA